MFSLLKNVVSLFSRLDLLSTSFFVLFFFLLAFFWFFPRKRMFIVIAFNLLFYYSNGKKSFLLLLYQIFVSYFFGCLISKKTRYKKFFLVLGIIFIVSPLLLIRLVQLFGYVGLYLNENVSRLFINIIAISYTTLMSISYLVDLMNNECKRNSIIEHMFFISYFPCALSGPVECSCNIVGQLEGIQKKIFSKELFYMGLLKIAYGFFVKFVVTTRLAVIVNLVFGNVHSFFGLEIFFASIFYSIQIYCDFMAYSYIACGISELWE